MNKSEQAFNGLRVAAFESRMAEEMARLIGRCGGEPLVAPSMREIPLEQNPEALRFGENLLAGQFNVVILLTGVGTRTMVQVLQTRQPLDRIEANGREVAEALASLRATNSKK
ncbi:MAG: hypothetical protein ACREIE_00135 [Nitrospiraceae bacterium]